MFQLTSTIRLVSKLYKLDLLRPFIQVCTASTDFNFHKSTPPADAGETKEMNLVQSLCHTMDLAMERDPSMIVFGEDVAFGGVFRYTQAVALKFSVRS